MKNKRNRKLFIFTVVFLAVAVALFVVYGVLRGVGYDNYWTNLALGLAITTVCIGIFLLIIYLLNHQKPIEIEDGRRCPYCGTVFSKEEHICPTCGRDLDDEEHSEFK